MILGIYCRNSQDDGESRSIDNQKKIGIEKANELGYQHKLYIDRGLSGASDNIEDRPAFQQLLNDVNEKAIDAVFAYDQSRFERNPKVRFIINDSLKRNQIEYYTFVDGKVDLFDPTEEFQGDLLSIINKYHVTMTKIKVKSVLKQRAEEGKVHGILPYGYTSDLDGKIKIDEEEKKIIYLIFELSFNGTGTNKIAEILNKQEVPTRYNKISKGTLKTKNKYTGELTITEKNKIKWSGNTIRNIITNKVYTGKRTYGGVEYDIPSIIDKVEFDRVNENLTKNRNNSGKKVEHKYLLKGLITCGLCGRNMYGRSRLSKKDHYYMCSSKRIKDENCGNRSINIDRLEDFIWHTVFTNESFFDNIKSYFEQDSNDLQKTIDYRDQLEKKLNGINKQREKALEMATKEIISFEEFDSKSKIYLAQAKELSINIKDINKNIDFIKNNRNKFIKYKSNFVDFTNVTSFRQKKSIINDFIKNIKIKCYDDIYQLITIKYKIDFPDENWQSSNLKCTTFNKIYTDENGMKKILFSVPPPISNPSDDSLSKKYFPL